MRRRAGQAAPVWPELFESGEAVSLGVLVCYVWGWSLDSAGNLSGGYDLERLADVVWATPTLPGIAYHGTINYVVVDPVEFAAWVERARQLYVLERVRRWG